MKCRSPTWSDDSGKHSAPSMLSESAPDARPVYATVVKIRKTRGENLGIIFAQCQSDTGFPTILSFQSRSAAERNDKLAPGDRVRSVNGISAARMNPDEITTLLDSVIDGTVTLELEYNLPEYSSQDSACIRTKMTTMTLECVDGSLGVTLRAGVSQILSSNSTLSNSNEPLVVTNVRPGGAAHRSGRIKVGDRLLKIDHRSVSNKTLLDAQQLLKQQSGSSDAVCGLRAHACELTLEYDVRAVEGVRRAAGPLLLEIERRAHEHLGLVFASCRSTASAAVCIQSVIPASIADRGQKFFHDNMFVMFFAKFCGLLTTLAIPSMLNILKLTNMTSTPLAAYRRYMATIYHMTLWYDKDFSPESKSWQSIRTVRNLHFSASSRARNTKLQGISQADMVLTQFAFIGYVFTQPKLMGFHKVTDEELESVGHLWRVVGHLLGIEDRFNLCNGTVEEIKEYCNLLVQNVLAPGLKEAGEDFKQMSFTFVDGMSVFQPCINYSVVMIYVHQMCNVSIEDNNKRVTFFTLTWIDRIFLHFTRFVIYTYQFLIIRLYHNATQRFALYHIIKRFPFLAYKKFGFKNGKLPESIVNIN